MDSKTTDLEKDNLEKYGGKFYDANKITTLPSPESTIHADVVLQIRINLAAQYAVGAKVLDLCCGTGEHLFSLADRCNLGVGFDYSLPFIQRANQTKAINKNQNVEFVEGNAKVLPFPGNYFDLVYSFSALYHINHVEEIIAEIARVLKPGGKCVIDLGNLYSLNTLVCHAYPELAHPFHIPVKLMKRFIHESQLGVLEHRAFQILPMWADRPMWLRPLLSPLWTRLLERKFKGVMLDEWICNLPDLISLPFAIYLFVRKDNIMPVQNRYSNFVEDQRTFFDELITEDWETYDLPAWDYARTFEIQKLFERIQPARILDVGCGVGFHDAVMAEYPFVEHVDAFDYSEQSILRANKEYPHTKVDRVVSDFSSFEVKQPYDLVSSFQVFEHLMEPQKYLAFCADACRQGGTIAICTPNRLRLDNRLLLLRGRSPELIDIMHFKEYTAREIYQMGEQFNLKPAGWFGHTLYNTTRWTRSWSAKWDYPKRTQMGYSFRHFAHVICVLMRKG